jgi:hypothetical protein
VTRDALPLEQHLALSDITVTGRRSDSGGANGGDENTCQGQQRNEDDGEK